MIVDPVRRRRGAGMGALGRIYSNGDLDLALTIRTFAIVDDAIHLWGWRRHRLGLAAACGDRGVRG
jgi:anthranilate/para-aminobenzoate synthase component I